MKRFSQYALGIVFAVGLVACGKGQNEIKGKLGGQDLSPKSSTFTTATLDGSSVVSIALSDNENLCDQAKANKQKVGERILSLAVFSPKAVQPGKFDISALQSNAEGGTVLPTGTAAVASYAQADNACNLNPELGVSGTVTLTKVDKDTVQGSFDVVFSNGDKVSGSIDASACAVTADPNGPSPTCEK